MTHSFPTRCSSDLIAVIIGGYSIALHYFLNSFCYFFSDTRAMPQFLVLQRQMRCLANGLLLLLLAVVHAYQPSHVLSWSKTQQVTRSEEQTSELQSLMRISYAVFCCKKKKN